MLQKKSLEKPGNLLKNNPKHHVKQTNPSVFFTGGICFIDRFLWIRISQPWKPGRGPRA